LEETGFIFDFSGETFTFVADETPLLYEVTLTDFDFPTAFDVLAVAITTSTEPVVELLAPGTTTFSAEFGTTYFANVLGLADEAVGVGLFGIRVAAIPEPGTALLLAVGLMALALRRQRPCRFAGQERHHLAR
jgi:hypothetical protein